MRQRMSLGGDDWKLKGTDSYVPLRDRSMETGKPLQGITRWIDASVPGGVALALYRAGYIEHPYVGMNSLACEWIENRWWIYRKEFTKPRLSAKRMLLSFLGVDYECMVYLNGHLLGSHEGMYESFVYDITEIYDAADSFVLEVLLQGAPREMGQIGRTSLTATQKSRFGYKWDFSTRLVNLGIWQDVALVAEDQAVLEDLSVITDVLPDGTGVIHASGAVRKNEGNEPLAVEITVKREGQECAHMMAAVENGRFDAAQPIDNPALWYPNGMGEQPLYDVTLTLLATAPLDRRSFRVGIRHVDCLQNEGAPEDSLPYTLAVNGRRLYIKGVNITPMDHIYGDIPREQVAFQLRRAKEMHVNLVRVWGGGLIESEWFYDCCDRMGLLVWQEFIQSSSGIDNIPSEIPSFLVLLEKAARCAIMKKRNHTALVLWSGGNELMDEKRIPQTLDNKNLAMLGRLVGELDPSRLFLPTSASGPSPHIKPIPGMNHDVHGWWQYQGNPRHYEFYAGSDSLLHSEFGCDGMSSWQTVRKILPQEPKSPERMLDNDLWRFHGDWWCTYDREMAMFGPVEDVQQYILLSQFMQAEGLRYILEANRRRTWRNSGSIIWQLSEPWPNLSCTTLVDYYGHAKAAYFRAKAAFAPLHASLDYARLDYRPGEAFTAAVYLSADDMPAQAKAEVHAEVLDLKGTRLWSQVWKEVCPVQGSIKVGALAFEAPATPEGLFLVRLSAKLGDLVSQNEYCFSGSAEQPYRAIAALKGGTLTVRVPEAGEGSADIEIMNDGSSPVFQAFVQDALDEWNLYPEDNFRTLLPGESWRLHVSYSRRFRFGFDEYAQVCSIRPELEIRGIGLDGACPVPLDA